MRFFRCTLRNAPEAVQEGILALVKPAGVFRRWISENKAGFYLVVAMSDGVVVGVAGVSKEGNRHIAGWATAPALRRQGLAHELTRRLFRWHRPGELHVQPNDPAICALLARTAYRPAPPTGWYARYCLSSHPSEYQEG